MKMTMRISTLVAAFVLGVMPVPTSAQTILGRVLDQANEEPVSDVLVTLVTAEGQQRLRAITDVNGRFRLTPPESGEYRLSTERFGYYETTSPLIALGVDGEAPLELMIVPQPVGIEGVEVTVEERAEVELDMLGLTPTRLGNRWIGQARIEAIPVKRDLGVILENTAQAGLRIMRPNNVNLGDNMGLCVSFNRVVTADGGGKCALIVVNGVVTNGISALDIDANSVESMAVLDPIEASTFYGTEGGGGAILVWTSRGR